MGSKSAASEPDRLFALFLGLAALSSEPESPFLELIQPPMNQLRFTEWARIVEDIHQTIGARN
jgi:hypothetical protein